MSPRIFLGRRIAAMEDYSAEKYLRKLNAASQNPRLAGQPGFRIHAFIRKGLSGRPVRLTIRNLVLKLGNDKEPGTLTATEHGKFKAPALYQVEWYRYHLQHPRVSVRFDSHTGLILDPHVNDAKGSHIHYGDAFWLDTADMNLWLAINIANHFLRTGHSPLDSAHWGEYNNRLAYWREQIR